MFMWISDVIQLTVFYQASLFPFSNRGRIKISLEGVGGGMAGKWLPSDPLNFIQEQPVVYITSFTVLFFVCFCDSEDPTEKEPFFFNVTVLQPFPLFSAYKVFGPYYHMMGCSVHANSASGVYTRPTLLAEIWISHPGLWLVDASLPIYVQDPR